jgi:protease-4
MKNDSKKYWIMFLILGVLFVFSVIMAAIINIGNSDDVTAYNTAIIPIKGVISTESGTGLLSDDAANSRDIVKTIQQVQHDSRVRAVIFEINSPGGSPVATDEIAEAIKELNKDKLTVAWIREVGASGAYWVASSTDHIIANRMSIVGSIGVYGSYLEVYGLLNKYNITYRRLVSGEYKDTGSPFKPLSSQEEYMLQSKLDKLHEYFIEAVATNRNMSTDAVRTLATGEIFLGVEAKDNGLVDELGGQEQAVTYIENSLNITVETKEFTKRKTFLEALTQTINKNSFYVGEGISSGILQKTSPQITT